MIDVAPAWTVARAPAVQGRSMVRSRASYDGARTTDLNERAWRNADGLSARRANSLEKRRPLRNRSRYLYGNDPIVFGMFHKWANYLIGKTGPKRHVTTPDAELNAAVESRWQEWCYASRFVDQLRVRTVAKHVDGESFAELVTNEMLADAVKLDVNNFECDQCTSNRYDQNACDGIYFDEWRNPAVYDVLPHHPGDGFGVGGKPRRVAARNILHWFRMLRPGQVRGVPTMTPALELIVILGGFTISTARSAHTASAISVLLEEAVNTNGTFPADDETEQEVAANWSTQEINHDTMMKLPPGMTAKQLQALNPNERFEMFEKCILRRCAQSFPMPWCLAVGDHSGSNFSASRMDRLDFWTAIDVERQDCEREDLDRIFAAWLDEAVMVPGYLPLAIGAYMGQRLPGSWGWPGREYLSPMDEVQSQVMRIEKGLASEQDIAAENGTDWREIERKKAEVQAYRREIGLLSSQSAPAQGVPV